MALHSLRATTPQELQETVQTFRQICPDGPVHIHVAEQTKEVEDCVAWSGLRPVRWLLESAAVDRHWCLVHATHLDESEVTDLAASQAVAGICPTTEANLGDGIFAAEEYLAANGLFGIGTDSHVELCPAAELRLFEYGQRLSKRRRNVLADETSCGRRLWQDAVRGGSQALGRRAASIAVGNRADLVVLDTSAAECTSLTGDTILDHWIFAPGRVRVSDVYVGGRQVVKDGHHEAEAEATNALRSLYQNLRQS